MKKRFFCAMAGLLAVFLAVCSFYPYQQAAWEWRRMLDALRSAGYSIGEVTSEYPKGQTIGLPESRYYLRCSMKKGSEIEFSARVFRDPEDTDIYAYHYALSGTMSITKWPTRTYSTPHLHVVFSGETDKELVCICELLPEYISD